MYRPGESIFREEILNKIETSAEHFRKGDPEHKVKKLKESLTEAIKLQLRIKWLTGRKIISVLSERHNTFAVRLAPYLNTASNQDDATDHIDKMLNTIEECCDDIALSQGDIWYSNSQVRAHTATDGKNHYDQLCRFDGRCTRKDCRYLHTKDKRTFGGPCQHNPCHQKASGKDKKFCTTCLRKGLRKDRYH